jgi:phosphatidylserine/phosphatidylglycerophosphate/cardiolipin synthase-like enzyme
MRFSSLLALAVTCAAQTIFANQPGPQPDVQSWQKYIRQYKVPQLILDNNSAFEARIKLLDNAPRGSKVKILSFIHDVGIVTTKLASHACAAAQRGVEVQFMTDAKSGAKLGKHEFMSYESEVTEEIYQYMVQCGVQVTVHNIYDDNELKITKKELDESIGIIKRIMNVYLTDISKDAGSQIPPAFVAELQKQIPPLDWPIIGPLLRFQGRWTILNPLIRFGFAHFGHKAINDALEAKVAEALKNAPRKYDLSRRKNGESPWYVSDDAEVKFPYEILELLRQINAAATKDENLRGTIRDIIETKKVAWLKINRLNHRKLFWVQGTGESGTCFLLGGRNLGDHYLNWDDMKGNWVDGDVLLCDHMPVLAGRNENKIKKTVTDSMNSFMHLWNDDDAQEEALPRDLAAPLLNYYVKEIPGYQFKTLLLEPARDGYSQPEKFLDSKNKMRVSAPIPNWRERDLPHDPMEIKEIAIPLPIRMNDPEIATLGFSLNDTYDWQVLTTTWKELHDYVQYKVVDMINRENLEINIESPYVTFAPEISKPLENKLSGGIRVNITTNSFFTADGASGAISFVNALWVRKMSKLYGLTSAQARDGKDNNELDQKCNDPEVMKKDKDCNPLFTLRATAIEGSGHMIHFKGMQFQCQFANGEFYRASLIGSHNFHKRSGISDKEHALYWKQPPGQDCIDRILKIADDPNPSKYPEGAVEAARKYKARIDKKAWVFKSDALDMGQYKRGQWKRINCRILARKDRRSAEERKNSHGHYVPPIDTTFEQTCISTKKSAEGKTIDEVTTSESSGAVLKKYSNLFQEFEDVRDNVVNGEFKSRVEFDAPMKIKYYMMWAIYNFMTEKVPSKDGKSVEVQLTQTAQERLRDYGDFLNLIAIFL